MALTIGIELAATIKIPRTGDSIAINHLHACHAPTLATLYNSLDFHESTAIKYRAPSQTRTIGKV
jgi:hypothetical protein